MKKPDKIITELIEYDASTLSIETIQGILNNLKTRKDSPMIFLPRIPVYYFEKWVKMDERHFLVNKLK